MINLTWQDDGFGNLVFTPQDAWDFNLLEIYDLYDDAVIRH